MYKQNNITTISYLARKTRPGYKAETGTVSEKSVCITMETGFQVVVGAALGCQLVPPVILFSPGWLQWMSL